MLLNLVFSVLILQICSAYKMLLVFPIPYRSHAILGEAFVKHLTKAGHEVTYLTPYRLKYHHENVSQVEVSTKGLFDEAFTVDRLLKKQTNSGDAFRLFHGVMDAAHKTLTNENVLKLLNDQNIHFDIIIIERMFIDVYTGFSAVFKCPYISFFSFHDDFDILQLIHEVPNPSYTANIATANIPPFNFFQRAQELLFQVFSMTLRKFYFEPREKALYDQVFEPILKKRGRTLPPYEELKYNASLAFSTSHISIGNSYVQPNALKLIGGFHIDSNIRPLPETLQKIMDTSKHGVILFSLGSQLSTESMPKEMRKDLLRVFSSLKYTILLKAGKIEEDLPENVMALSWIPQQSVLAHPNCVLFITHGGILSITETVHFGVPVVGIPAFADQFINIKTAVKNGYAKHVTLSVNMGDQLKDAIEEVISNPKYRQHALETSMIYHSRLVPPGRALVQWTEVAVRTRGAAHLRSPALRTAAHHKLYLDLLAAAALLLVAALYLIKKAMITCVKCDDNKKNK